MKLLAILGILCLLTGPVVAFTLPDLASFSWQSKPSKGPALTFEGGKRYDAGGYPVIVLTGSFRQMGRQYGGLMKTELNEEYAYILDSLAKRGYTRDQVRAMGREAAVLYPQRQMELFEGMAETSGLTTDDVLALYNGIILFLMVQPAPASCSYLATWGNYTTDGSVVVSRNWDLDDAVLPFTPWYALVVYRPTDGSNGVATFGPAGTRPETLMNSRGLFIADDNSGIFDDDAPDTRPDLFSEFFRFMLDYSDLAGLKMGVQGARPNLAWIIDVAGPESAYVYEVMTNETKVRTGDGVVAAANHFVDPSWKQASPPPEHTATRYNNLLKQAEDAKGSIDAAKMMEIRDVAWEKGGATFLHSALSPTSPESLYTTNHMVVFVPKSQTLWMKVPDKSWQKVELAPLFGT